MGALIHGHQDLTSDLTLSLVAYGNRRDADSAVYQGAVSRQIRGDSRTKQIGGTLSLDWQLGANWLLTLAQTNAISDVTRLNTFNPPAGANAFTRVLADHEFESTQIGAEGPLFSMPGGQARLAVGAERREESLEVTRINITDGQSHSRSVRAAYMEAFLPLVGENNGGALANRLELTGAVRYEDYDDVGESTNSKFGLLWSPLPHLNLRGTYGTAFRAPYLYQLDRSLRWATTSTHPILPRPRA